LQSALLDALRELPGGERLLAAASVAADAQAHLVGGSVRDLLRDVAPRELDVVVEGNIAPLLEALGGADVLHERFGTASLSVDGARVDVTTSRRERYAHPGALPEVEAAPLDADLLRRDFTVNAVAVSLPQGELRAAPRAEEDLARGLLRVLHDESFVDDPTRLWRLGRYAARLGFIAEEHTAALAQAALGAGATDTVSGARTGAELRLVLGEDDPVRALGQLDSLGVLGAAGLAPRISAEEMRSALELLPPDGRPDLLLLVALLADPAQQEAQRDDHYGREQEIAQLLDRLEFTAAERDRVVAGALSLPRLLRELSGRSQPSRLYALVAELPIEAVALAGALAGAGEALLRANAERWLHELRHVRVRINGSDLIAAGIPEGPEIGRRLRAVLALRLDGALADDRDAELRAALAPGGGERH
jgi:tRNA nucleotidyltransferase (CCA-adding enzyme)